MNEPKNCGESLLSGSRNSTCSSNLLGSVS
jgi:hypothetical protein